MADPMGRIRIGTSNWAQPEIRKQLPRHRLAPGAMLEAYSRVLDTVEINSTFYRFHQAKTFVGWKTRVPSAFIFAIKANRLFTHERRLSESSTELSHLLTDISALGGTLGPLLFQIPASFRLELTRLRGFIAALKRAMSETGCIPRVAFELRHPSWHSPAVFSILQKAKMGFCLFDMRKFTSPIQLTADFVYLRLHGPNETPYQGLYGREALLPWAERLLDWQSRGIDSYIYLDNTRFGEAVPDALTLRNLTGVEDTHLAAMGKTGSS